MSSKCSLYVRDCFEAWKHDEATEQRSQILPPGCREELDNSSSCSEANEGQDWLRTLRADEMRHSLTKQVMAGLSPSGLACRAQLL